MQGSAFMGTGDTPITMKATVILKPERALEFTITGFGMGGASADEGMTYIIIGDKAWMILGGAAMEVPEDSAGSFDDMFDSLAPDTLFGSQVTSYASGMQKVGTEQKNGVAAIHYEADDATVEALAKAMAGSDIVYDAADWTMDVWIAQEGGYLVSMIQKGIIKSGETSVPYLLEMNITNIDDPANKVEAPK